MLHHLDIPYNQASELRQANSHLQAAWLTLDSSNRHSSLLPCKPLLLIKSHTDSQCLASLPLVDRILQIYLSALPSTHLQSMLLSSSNFTTVHLVQMERRQMLHQLLNLHHHVPQRLL